MSLIMVGKKKFVELVEGFHNPEQKSVVHALDNHALRLVRFTGEFFNGVRTATNYHGDVAAIERYNKGRLEKIEEYKADGDSQEEAENKVKGEALIPEPDLESGEYFTIGGETKYLVTNKDGIWLSWSHGKSVYVTPIARADVKSFSDSIAVKAFVVPTATFCIVGE